MKYFFILAFTLLFFPRAEAQFSKLFDAKTLRLDYYHCGNDTVEKIYFGKLVEEPNWGGSKVSLIDSFAYGNQMLEVRDLATKKLIYSHGFSTLFDEWQTTAEAKTTDCCYPESAVMPFPKEKVVISILSRKKDGVFVKKFEYTVDPKSDYINKEREKLPVFDIVNSGDPAKKVDIVLLPEGYTEKQRKLFMDDCRNFAEYFFSYSPYSENQDNFNIRAVWAPSEDEGPDIPGKNIWNKTRLNGSYYTFGSERYLMIKDFQGVRDVAANAPYDYIYILANTEKYGGGAIYNFYGISAAHHVNESGKIYIHEFGHLFAGLGDEYVGGVEYSDFYSPEVEPWEPNLTTLVHFDRKWEDMLPRGTKIPTPDIQANEGKLGVYQGGGYVSKGVYRPWVNCLMNNLHTIDVFCPVCSKAIQDMIDFNCR